MNAVAEKASLHEKAVQKVARGEHKIKKARRPRSKSKNSKVARVSVDPLITNYLRGRGISLSDVQVVTATEVIVWNNPRKRPVVTRG